MLRNVVPPSPGRDATLPTRPERLGVSGRLVAKLTGERPMEGSTPDSLLALHDAGYREVAARLGPGVVLDVGCGVGDETVRLAAPDRLVIGVDYSAATVVETGSRHRGDGLRFAGMDGACLGMRRGTVDWVVSSHIIEHFTNPVLHVAELARVLHDDGTAFVITPNAPADFENPFHVYLFEPAHLVSMLELLFEDVECLGLDGDEVLRADFAARRKSGERILRLDPLGLRTRIPRRAYVWTYERALPVVYRMLGSSTSGVGSGIDASHLFITHHILPTTPVLFAIARGPRRPARTRT
jgi:SAM-dependent methyltransferase